MWEFEWLFWDLEWDDEYPLNLGRGRGLPVRSH